jgi:RimJ/RimL family protein N-acetyltransferase
MKGFALATGGVAVTALVCYGLNTLLSRTTKQSQPPTATKEEIKLPALAPTSMPVLKPKPKPDPISHMRTARLVLRLFSRSDINALFKIESKADMARYQSFEPRTYESTQIYIEEAVAAAQATRRRCYEYAICLKQADGSDGELIGRVGAVADKEDSGLAWMWYVVDTESQGQGYAKEAAHAFLYVLRAHGFARVAIECDERNVSSVRLAEALGFIEHAEERRVDTCKGELCSLLHLYLQLPGTGITPVVRRKPSTLPAELITQAIFGA